MIIKIKMELITLKEAFDIVMRSAPFTGTETVNFTDSLDRVLASDIKSDIDMPPFNKATVDGFACRRDDLNSELAIVETIAAGIKPVYKISENQCSGIMTGAVLPEGADVVFMVEDSKVNDGKVRFTGSFTKDNIALKGEDIKDGQTVLRSGKIIKPQDIALLASSGSTSVEVSRRPSAGVISSGDELVEPSLKPGIAQIRNTNSYQLMAQLKRAGAIGKNYGIVRDDEAATYEIVMRAISENDIILISGGVSMGDFDFIPAVMERAGVKILFSRINVQPGKPTTFGVHPDALVFGLPGNPVSSFIQFELLVRPMISRMMGCEFKPVTFPAIMKNSFSRKNAERHALIPVMITENGLADPVEYHGSAHLSAMSEADGIIEMPAGVRIIMEEETVSVRQI